MKCTWLVALTLLQHFPQRPENVLENVLGIEMYDELVSLEYQPLHCWNISHCITGISTIVSLEYQPLYRLKINHCITVISAIILLEYQPLYRWNIDHFVVPYFRHMT